MGKTFGSYRPKVVCKLFTFYAASIYLITLVGKRSQDQPLLAHTLVRVTQVDLPEKTIRRFLFRLGYKISTTTVEFDYRMELVWSQREMKNPKQWRDLKRWVAWQIEEHGVDVPSGKGKTKIKKSTLYFVEKFWWTIFRHKLCPTTMDKTHTLDRAILVAKIIVGYDIDFDRCIHEEIHERDFKEVTNTSFFYLIQRLYDIEKVPT